MCTNSVTKQPHKHAALIKAWADGAEIEYLSIDKMWYGASTPSWDVNYTFRIKPEPKPDVVSYAHVDSRETWCRPFVVISSSTNWDKDKTPCYARSVNVAFTFDGETGKLKDARFIK